MAHTITEDCVACGVCAEECPSDAIIEGDEIYSINADACTDCGACVDVCASNAIEAP